MIVVDQIPVILGDPGTSVVLLSGSVAQELPLSVTHKGGLSSGDRAKTVVIYVETAQIRFAFGADPNPSTPFGYPVSSGSWIILTKRSEINIFNHIRESLTDALMTDTPVEILVYP